MSKIQPRVVLSAGNIAHYHNTARALYLAGYLERYMCSVAVTRTPWWARLLPTHLRSGLEHRKIQGVSPKKIRAIPLGEALARLLSDTHLMSRGFSFLLASQIYDWLGYSTLASSDIFHFVSGSGLACAMKAKQRGATIVCDVRTPYPDAQDSLVQNEYDKLGLGTYVPDHLPMLSKIKREYELSDYFILPSQYAADTFINAGYCPEQIFVVPYGVDVDQFKPADPKSDNVFRVLFVGAVYPLKGVQYLLSAFEGLNLKNSELCVIGSMLPSMQTLMSEYSDRLTDFKVVGFIPHKNLHEYYAQASVFVLPSVSEGMALVVAEAMSSGLPVIVTHNTGFSDIVREGKDGFVIDTGSPEQIREKLLWLYDHPEEARQMGKSAAIRIHEYTWEAYGQRLLAVYEEILKRKKLVRLP